MNEPWCTPSLLCDGLLPQDDPNGAHGRLLCCRYSYQTNSTDDVKALIRCASRLAPKNTEEVWCPPVHLVACEALAKHAPATPRLAAAENACIERILARGTRPDTLPGEGRLDAALCVRRCARLIGEDANEALKLLDEDVADPVAIGLLGAAAKACGIVRDERFLDDLDLDEETCDIGEGRVPPYVVQAELRRLTTASPSRRAAALKLALAAAACGSLHEAVVEVEVPAAVVESSRRWPEASARGRGAIEGDTTKRPRARVVVLPGQRRRFTEAGRRARVCAAPGPAFFSNSGVPGPRVRF